MKLYEKGLRGFKVKICGVCKSWDFYQKRIRYPELFDLNIGFVKNEDIPNLLSESHYCVQPYRAVSQSGVVKVAFQYDTPVIVSNLPGFMDEVVEGLNGFSFMVENVSDLERFDNDTVVDIDLLTKEGLVRKELDGLKVLGQGNLTKKLTVVASKFSKSAEEKILAAGGKIEVK